MDKVQKLINETARELAKEGKVTARDTAKPPKQPADSLKKTIETQTPQVLVDYSPMVKGAIQARAADIQNNIAGFEEAIRTLKAELAALQAFNEQYTEPH